MSEFDERNLYQNPTQFQLSCFNPSELLNTYDKYMHLKLYVNDNDNDNNELKQKYIDAACNHNNKILNFVKLSSWFCCIAFQLILKIKKFYNVDHI